MLLFPLPLYGNLFGRFLLLFIGKNKCKIKERTTEHKRDVHLNKETTALAKLNRKENIEIDFTHIKKLSNYENHNCPKMRKYRNHCRKTVLQHYRA